MGELSPSPTSAENWAFHEPSCLGHWADRAPGSLLGQNVNGTCRMRPWSGPGEVLSPVIRPPAAARRPVTGESRSLGVRTQLRRVVPDPAILKSWASGPQVCLARLLPICHTRKSPVFQGLPRMPPEFLNDITFRWCSETVEAPVFPGFPNVLLSRNWQKSSLGIDLMRYFVACPETDIGNEEWA